MAMGSITAVNYLWGLSQCMAHYVSHGHTPPEPFLSVRRSSEGTNTIDLYKIKSS